MEGNDSLWLTRRPAVAGQFYPSDPEELTEVIEQYLAQAPKTVDSHVFGLVSPHAGYIYSGPVAAHGYKQLIGSSYRTVVVISPSHFVSIPYASVLTDGEYITPLGSILIDGDSAENIIEVGKPAVKGSIAGHAYGKGNRGEHALEVQLPFLQVVLKRFSLVPIIMGDQSWPACQNLAEAIVAGCDMRKTLVVASSDLSHYNPYKVARTIDAELLAMLREADGEGIAMGCKMQELEACGGGPIATLLEIGKLVGDNAVKVCQYATSGDIPGGARDQVVGYTSAVIYGLL
jgi:AmmeMemoRadiSam system protein B